jgi:hypothetical protein
MTNYREEFNKFIPGFTMGITRAIISHPFEILKLKSQMNIKDNFYKNLFKGVHLSILSNSFERGIQFYWFDKFKKKYNNDLLSSFSASLISTGITLPYNVILLKKTLLKNTDKVTKKILFKSGSLEYLRNISGSTVFLYSYNYFRSDNKYPIYISAITSSFIVWGFTYPIDNIKNQIIAERNINYNILNLYKGIQYPLIRSIPSSIVGFYVFECVNNYFNNNII